MDGRLELPHHVLPNVGEEKSPVTNLTLLGCRDRRRDEDTRIPLPASLKRRPFPLLENSCIR